MGGGVPDILVGWKGINYLLEIKREKGKLTQDQVSFHDEWRGTIFTVRTIEEALQVLGVL